MNCEFTTTAADKSTFSCTLGLNHDGKHRMLPTRKQAPPQAPPKAQVAVVWRVPAVPKPRPASLQQPRVRGEERWHAEIGDFVEDLRLRNLSGQTVRLRRYHLQRLAAEIRKNPYNVTLKDLLTWFNKHDWGVETAASVSVSLKVFYTWAVKDGRTPTNPMDDFPKIGKPKHRAKPVPDDVYAAAMAAADDRVRIAMRLGGELGLRRAEIAGMHADHLTQEAGRWVLTVVGKGAKTRHLPVPATLAEELSQIWAAQHGGYLFPSQRGGHITPHWLGTLISRALPGDYTAHKLRHRALTRVYQNTKDIVTTAAIAGHSSIVTTQQHYVAVDEDAMAAALEDIAS